LSVLAAVAAALPGEKPAALRELQASRAYLRTGRIIWSTRCNLPRERDDIIWYWHSYDVPRYFVSQFTPNEYMVEDNGDPQGIVWPMRDGAPHPVVGLLRRRYLWAEDKSWQYREMDSSASVRDSRDLPIVDARALGVAAGLASTPDFAAWLSAAGTEDATYEVQETGGLCHVSEIRGKSVTEYVLDPQRGWNAVRVTRSSGGEIISEARSKLTKYGDAWFPEQVELYSREHMNGEEPVYVIDVLFAAFNQPEDPQSLTPESMGVDVGMTIDVYGPGPGRPKARYFWDGKKMITEQEFSARLASGELEYGPRTKLAMNFVDAMAPDLEAWEERWKHYTIDFANKYQLDSAQSSHAWRILVDCVTSGHQYLDRHKEEIEKIRDQMRELVDPSESKPAGASEKAQQLAQRMLELRAPLTEIFLGRLVPRLEEIPTRAQREAAAARGAVPQARRRAQSQPSP